MKELRLTGKYNVIEERGKKQINLFAQDNLQSISMEPEDSRKETGKEKKLKKI